MYRSTKVSCAWTRFTSSVVRKSGFILFVVGASFESSTFLMKDRFTSSHNSSMGRPSRLNLLQPDAVATANTSSCSIPASTHSLHIRQIAVDQSCPSGTPL